jgi:uncharacterized membrane protein
METDQPVSKEAIEDSRVILQTTKTKRPPLHDGVKIQQAITILKTPEEIFTFWRNFSNLPRFMSHVKSVRVQDNKKSHWQVDGILKQSLEWDAEIIEEKSGQMISWRTIGDADVPQTGSVWFTPVAGRPNETEVRIQIMYKPPAGKFGDWVAHLMARDPATQILQDLHRLKAFLETGEIPTTEGQPSGRRQNQQETRH